MVEQPVTRTVKIQKLSNAIKDYLGSYGANDGVWIRAPKPREIERVGRWLDRLNIPYEAGLEKIHNFHNVGEFNSWIKTL